MSQVLIRLWIISEREHKVHPKDYVFLQVRPTIMVIFLFLRLLKDFFSYNFINSSRSQRPCDLTV